jgi:hypothetical protein
MEHAYHLGLGRGVGLLDINVHPLFYLSAKRQVEGKSDLKFVVCS